MFGSNDNEALPGCSTISWNICSTFSMTAKRLSVSCSLKTERERERQIKVLERERERERAREADKPAADIDEECDHFLDELCTKMHWQCAQHAQTELSNGYGHRNAAQSVAIEDHQRLVQYGLQERERKRRI